MIDWFAFEVELFLQGKAEQNQFSQVKLQNEQVMGKNENHLKANFLANRNYQAANPDLVGKITP